MSSTLLILVIGICTGFVFGAGLAFSILFCFMFRKNRVDVEKSGPMRSAVVTLQVKEADSSLSDPNVAFESPRTSEWSNTALWLEGLRKKNAACGIPKYSYKEIEKATSNFTTIIGNGAFGSVYKAVMSTGETVAVKVLGANSRQGEQEFLTEVLLLGRLHHKNLVGLVGYAAERGQHMLLYNYMSNGCLASHLYGDNHERLSWDLRFNVALDVAMVLEYLHYGADPPVVHRDIKSSNILLDQFMKAKITDFGLSRPEMTKPRLSNVRGTFGYLDPEYIDTRTYTTKSDVYSFGVLLFELITGRNPQQGLMEYVKLATMESDGKNGWEEIVDPVLKGNYDVHKLNDMASLAFKCVNEISKIRPSMREIVQALSQLYKKPNINSNRASSSTLSKSPSALYEVSLEVKQSEDLRRLHSR
ncbi:calcium/calmodulin-regulated receptor kinase [Trifolium repens]|nr:calcium/calmodulin-regulated receptor kinase [Trifolium repens]